MKYNFGLQDTPRDDRDFQLGAITSLPKLSSLPPTYQLPPAEIKNQGSSDFCSAYMTCTMSEIHEGFPLEPSWSFAVSKAISGGVHQWGQNLRDALKAHLKGALPEDQSPYSIRNKDPEFLRDIDNWPDLYTAAWPHRKKSFFKVTGPYDHFDNARAALYKFGSAIGTGVLWGWPVNRKTLDTIPDTGYGHAVTIIGYNEDHLIMQNSYGPRVGENGYFYITREVYNHFSGRYGHYMFVDITKEEARRKLEKKTHWGRQLLETILGWLRSLLRY